MKSKLIKKILSVTLAASMVLTGALSSIPVKAASASDPTLAVDMSQSGRDLKHGSSGWLYGLGDDEVPTANTITPLKAHTTVQKAPLGMQHPNGDTLDIAGTFLNAGGQHIQIYVPDYYALWFYEFSSTEEYLKILEMQARECIAAGIENDVVYVLYNEPSANWIGGSYYFEDTDTTYTGWYSVYYFWVDMTRLLRRVYEEEGVEEAPKTAGLNLAYYDSTVMRNYLTVCKEYDSVPDVITWHDLSTGQFNRFDWEYNDYRQIEKDLELGEHEISINEYADRYECASPGQLVRWIGLFEEYDVTACLPFWHLSNNLNGLAADNNEGNGAWWLYKWYGDMSGDYLPVTTSNAAKDTFYGAASLDENKKNSNVIFGGVDGDANIVLENTDDTQTFANADKVHVKIESTDYTGFHGVADEPRVVAEGAVAVVDGTVTVPVTGMNSMSAYNLTVTQAAEDETVGLLSGTWKALYEAEDGVLSGSARASATDGGHAGSGRRKVDYVDTASDKVAITVDVPADGYYKFDLVYCAATGCNSSDPSQNTPYTAIQTLTIDDSEVLEMVLPTTLNWSMGGMYSTYLKLEAGTHTLTIAGTESTGKAVPDCIYLTYKGSSELDIEFNATYEAELGEFNELNGTSTALTTEKEGSIGYITGLEKQSVTDGGGVRFTTVVPDNGMYTVTMRYRAANNAAANIYIDNDAVNLNNHRAAVALDGTGDSWANAYQTVFLQKGINIVDIDATAAMELDYINIRQASVSEPIDTVEAEDGTLNGEAAVGTNSNVTAFASGSSYVSGIKAANDVEVIPEDDDDFTIYGLGRFVDLGEEVDQNNLEITVNVEEAGEYKLLVYQSSGELFGRHDYNSQMTERYASFAVNGDVENAQKVVFRNTYSDEVFKPRALTVSLKAGANTIKVFNDSSKVVTNGLHRGGSKEPANIDYGVLVNYTPNLDKFEIYPLDAQTQADDNLYRIDASATSGGSVYADKNIVKEGDSVTLTFQSEAGAYLQDATVNGESIQDKLSSIGGVYILDKIDANVTVKAYFVESGSVQTGQEAYYYAVNAGTMDPTQFAPGDRVAEYQSVTDQFYGEDDVTGKYWGIVDTYSYSSSYPDLLTGAKTWPCENQGHTVSTSRSQSFRYARNQATSDVGVVYKFELEPGETYNLSMGFYVPSAWTSGSSPRTMKLVVNGNTLNERFEASNSASSPYILNYVVSADENGKMEIQVGHASNAVWGPVVSYIDIYRTDMSKLEEAVEEYSDYDESDYSESSWSIFKEVFDRAINCLTEKTASQDEINALHRDLVSAASMLIEIYDQNLYDSLAALVQKYSTYQQGSASDEDWNEFKNALANAEFVLNNAYATKAILEAAAQRLETAAEALEGIVIPDVDKTLLQMTVDVANSFTLPNTLHPIVKQNFEDALAHAQNILDSDSATQKDVDKADEALIRSIHYLSFTADYVKLKTAYDDAQTLIDSGNYEDDANMAKYKEIVDRIKDMLGAKDVLDKEIEEILAELDAAGNDLVPVSDSIDTSRLEYVLRVAEKVNSNLALYYDGDAKDEFVLAYANAQRALADKSSQYDVDSAANRLHSSMLYLQLIPSKEALAELLREAENINSALYTKESYAVLAAAIANGRSVYNDPYAAEEEIEDAQIQLMNAMIQLVELEDPDDSESESETESESLPASESTDESESKSDPGQTDGQGTDAQTDPKTDDTSGGSGQSDTSAGGKGTGNSGKDSKVKTGDYAPLALLLVLMSLSGAAIIMIKKKRV